MAQPFKNFQSGIEGPAAGAFAVTPADGADLPHDIRQVTIGGAAGTITYQDWNGAQWTTGSLPAGTYPMLARRILASGTTATVMTGWL